ncbi:iron ABC transporter permease [Thalassotalea sp. LPB0316]|nr:iron ABC transporter permease [Thalassotalea sp. LPB0316]
MRAKTISLFIVVCLLTLALLTPVLVMFYQGAFAPFSLFIHLWQTVLPQYLSNTLLLGFNVVVLSLLFGGVSALALHFLPIKGSRYLRWLLLLPLAMPAYLIAYLYTDLFDYAGPVQRFLRTVFGWQSPNDYWFFDLRTLGGASVIIALVLFPYVYMLTRTALENIDPKLLQANQSLGQTPWHGIKRIILPLIRPTLAVAATLVLMETLADFATVQYFAVNTLTTAIYDTWLGYSDLATANALASILLLLVFMVVVLEQRSRASLNNQSQNLAMSQSLFTTSKPLIALATSFCWLLVIAGFVLPLSLLLVMAWQYSSIEQLTQLLTIGGNSIYVSAMAATVALVLALLFSFYQKFAKHKLAFIPVSFSGLGYAIPGTVLAMALLSTFGPIDFWLNDLADAIGYGRPGLVLSGTVFAIVFAFVVRFMAIANGTITSGLEQVPDNLSKAARSLGSKPSTMVRRVHLPLLKSSIFVAWLLVFVESMKELPAVLLLRPFNFETLSTFIYQLISDEQLEQGAMGAILIVVFGLIPIIWLNRKQEV